MSRNQDAVSSEPLSVGVLGSPTGWYLCDLQRAANEMPQNRRTTITSLSFSHMSVWSDGQTDVRTLENTLDSSESRRSGGQQSLRAFDAVLVRTMPLGSLEQIVFRMNALHVAQSMGTPIWNPPRCLEIAIDKWLTLDVMRRHGIETPRTVVCQSREEAMAAFETLNGDCIVKPIFGGEGRGIVRVSDADVAWRVFSTLENLQAAIYVQEFLKSPGYDLRLLVVGDELFCVRRENGDDWRSNVSRGGNASPHDPTFEQISIAFRACKAVQGWMVGVDVLPTDDGRNMLLEVNAVPGWRATAAALRVDMATLMLHRLHEMRTEQNTSV
jgi:ribosomal protein S6--L-glutamate ligase